MNKNTSSSSYSTSLCPWPSCYHQNPKTISSLISDKPTNFDEPEPSPSSLLLSSSSSSTGQIKSIENVITRLKSSNRLIYERRGKSNSILEEATKREKEDKDFILFSLESNDPYSDFKNSMETMIEAHELHQDWRSLEKLLFWFLKVNVKSSHEYIFAAFVDLLVNDPDQEPSSDVVDESSSSFSSPLSFYTSNSSSEETSSTSIGLLPVNSKGVNSREVVCCLSSLFEMEKNIDNIDSSGYVSS